MDVRTISGLSSGELSQLVEQIGHTPLRPIDLVISERVQRVYLKLEGENPTGSIKDRTGDALIQEMERGGRLSKGVEVIESTSGNLGVALALICRARGYRFRAIIDPKTTRENIGKMEAFYAKIDMVRQPDVNGGYLLSRLARVRELCEESPGYVWTDQYNSPANPRVHYLHTGPEIYQQMGGHVGAIFAPVSTGGTLAGIGSFFREVSASTRIIGVDARGSVVFGTPPGPRKLTGIGSSRPSSFLSPALYDTYMLVGDEEAFSYCRILFRKTGIKVGGSSGATLAACARYLQVYPDLKNVVCVCSDDGENYTSSIFNHVWLEQQGILLTGAHLEPLQDILCPQTDQ